MKLTFLDFVNKSLSAIDSQSVSSATDSPEAEQVGLIVNRVYNEICSLRAWPWLRKRGTNLVSLSTNPWELDLPEEAMTLEYITYNKRELIYISPEEMQYRRNSRTWNTDTVNSVGVVYTSDPRYWTSFDDLTISFDSYDATYTNLLPSLCYTQYIKETPNDLNADTDIPIIHVRFHSVMLQYVLAIAFNELAQDTSKYDRAIAEYKRGLARMNKWARKIDQSLPIFQAPNYGRRSIYSPVYNRSRCKW